jgi:FMN-dependent NADH-azoreductase
MKKLLHIDSSVLGPHSVSRQVSAAIVERLRQATPNLDITYRDLTLTPLSHLSGANLAAAQGASIKDPAAQQELANSQTVLVARFSQIEGYRCLSLTRAADVAKCQLALV